LVSTRKYFEEGSLMGYRVPPRTTREITLESTDEPEVRVAVDGNSLHLTLLPALPVRLVADGKVILTKKFLDGINRDCRLWPGRIRVLMQETLQVTDNLDNVAVRREDLPFELRVIAPADQIDLAEQFRGTSVVVSSLDDYRQSQVSRVCRAAGIPCIYISEYSLRTRLQQVAAVARNPLRRWRSYFWHWNQERQRRRAVRLADGVQCNGTPTYDSYHRLNPNPLLYFDNRVLASMLATAEEVERRCSTMLAGQPLRLLFSGRLARIKGADHLIEVACALRQWNIPFRMSICGGGELEKSMRARIDGLGLADCVQMMGILRFDTELLPFAKENADLFVCCHRQGDPSCTYVETMACGVPIVGYENQAMAGLAQRYGLGWTVPMDRPKKLAAKIADLHQDRHQLHQMALKSLAFAQEHLFEKTLGNRLGQVLRVVQNSIAGKE
jgi:colanic acid/amylovoran biosynthesis glycosyltransferase